ncbi:SDR family NAD(P)-dependent oxidoreductase [Gryllotalpicola ginsengisoli]|uniref:SDR family NAD(P)-dependent oxidoreductase n=1 Tax=Gryllotalpicola ginsengisoli TaxID=444608 RepID=UPI0012DD8F61|nr:SDR family NAD(P)-dependent oxidoreductase [Gryllotalpicola ginsengisoli]
MNQRVVVITGASSGIGRAAAIALAARGARVAVVGRNPERTRAAAHEAGAEPFVADFDRLDDVRALADALLARYDRIDVLANNAGGLVAQRALTADGHERTFQSNVLAPFLLTELLLPRLAETAARDDVPEGGVRVLATASMANRWGRLRLDDLDWAQRPYQGGWPAYAAAKLAVVMWIRELAERLTGTGVEAFSVHPGVVATNFGDTSWLLKLGNAVLFHHVGRSAASGAAPLVALAGAERVAAVSGSYFSRFRAAGAVGAQALDPRLRRQLFDELQRLADVTTPDLTTPEADGDSTGTAAPAAR